MPKRGLGSLNNDIDPVDLRTPCQMADSSASHVESQGFVANEAPQEETSGAEFHVAGMEEALRELRELVAWPVRYAKEAAQLGLQWPRGILLHGPPGTGKTLLVHAVAKECGAHLHKVSASSIFGAFSGESERKLRESFHAAESDTASGAASILFIDEIDALCPKRDSRRQQEARVVAQLLTLMDGVGRGGRGGGGGGGGGHLLVVAATNRPNAIDPALRRPGRFDREVAVGLPSTSARVEILKLHSRALPLAADVDLPRLAAQCHGYVGADLAALCREAAMLALRELSTGAQQIRHVSTGAQQIRHVSGGAVDLADSSGSAPGGAGKGGGAGGEGLGEGGLGDGGGRGGGVGMCHFESSLKLVGPSVVRGHAVEGTAVKWEAIGGLHDVKRRLQRAVEWPILHAESFRRLGLAPPRGVLLHGPPGCSKTTLARAAAHAAKATLFTLSGAELFSMYTGEGEALLRETFRRARMASPSIVFFDEADAMGSRRSHTPTGASSSGGPTSSSSSERLLGTLLVEMDGLADGRVGDGVLVLAATNRPHALDAALMRPGRFELVLYVPPPDEEGRWEALKVHTAQMPLADDVDLRALAASTPLFTGAEIAGLCREAALSSLRESLEAAEVKQKHFLAARNGMRASLTELSLAAYAEFDTKKNRTRNRNVIANGNGNRGE